jgi:coenzyme F420 hydrogenase subunit beta
VRDVAQADLCAGCGLCQAIAGPDRIQLALDDQGFYRPQLVEDDAAAWPSIEQVCPGVVVRQEHNRQPAGLERTWGPIQAARVGHATDPEVRWQASSGGALSALLIYLLESDQVDAVLHTGPDAGDPFLTVASPSRDRQQVLAKAGSRYAPSAPLADLAEWLDSGLGRIAFVGKPCDVAALRAYGRLTPQIERQIVLHISFFCAGVPSLLATYDLVRALGIAREQVRQLRYRGFGWPGRATAIGLDGRAFSPGILDELPGVVGQDIGYPPAVPLQDLSRRRGRIGRRRLRRCLAPPPGPAQL